jgi:hypothetical protein
MAYPCLDLPVRTSPHNYLKRLSYYSTSRPEHRDRDQLCEFPEVLVRVSKEEPVSSAQRASWPETVEARMRLRCAKSTRALWQHIAEEEARPR